MRVLQDSDFFEARSRFHTVSCLVSQGSVCEEKQAGNCVDLDLLLGAVHNRGVATCFFRYLSTGSISNVLGVVLDEARPGFFNSSSTRGVCGSAWMESSGECFLHGILQLGDCLGLRELVRVVSAVLHVWRVFHGVYRWLLIQDMYWRMRTLDGDVLYDADVCGVGGVVTATSAVEGGLYMQNSCVLFVQRTQGVSCEYGLPSPLLGIGGVNIDYLRRTVPFVLGDLISAEYADRGCSALIAGPIMCKAVYYGIDYTSFTRQWDHGASISYSGCVCDIYLVDGDAGAWDERGALAFAHELCAFFEFHTLYDITSCFLNKGGDKQCVGGGGYDECCCGDTILLCVAAREIFDNSVYGPMQYRIHLCARKSVSHTLLEFDIDAEGLGWDGERFWSLPRASRAHLTFTNCLRPCLSGARLERHVQDVVKYMFRGFRFLDPTYDVLSRVRDACLDASTLGRFSPDCYSDDFSADERARADPWEYIRAVPAAAAAGTHTKEACCD